jgi:O-succinylbenzoate synthase
MISNPPEPVADFIFVHGLGGGSRKTWAQANKLDRYWPKEWLAQDPGFKNVRLHSFGYKADWQEMKDSILDIQDFAQSLLGEMRDSPGIRKSLVNI